MTEFDSTRPYRVLVCDLVGLERGDSGQPDCAEVRAHVVEAGEMFHSGPFRGQSLAPGVIHFFYVPNLDNGDEVLAEAAEGGYDAVIAAATVIPESAPFPLGGVRIGAGTGNMRSASWGGPDGAGGAAPLMNTPGFNSRATAQMVFKALLAALPDLPMAHLHGRVMAGDFDTGRHLRDYPTAGLAGRKLAVLGFGNIGREVARLGAAFDMRVSVYARERHRVWIEAEGFGYAPTPQAAAEGADVLSIHTGLGPLDRDTGLPANAGMVGDDILQALKPGAVVVNFDRGEVVDTQALARALAEARVGKVFVDADLFLDAESGQISGPLAPYRELAARYGDRVLLLPHAAADTDHPSRVAGAKQAVDQIRGAIRNRRITNLKGDLPPGFSDAGPLSPLGIGNVTEQSLLSVLGDPEKLGRLRALSAEIDAFLSALGSAADAEARRAVARVGAARFLQNAGRQSTLFRALGLQGRYDG